MVYFLDNSFPRVVCRPRISVMIRLFLDSESSLKNHFKSSFSSGRIGTTLAFRTLDSSVTDKPVYGLAKKTARSSESAPGYWTRGQARRDYASSRGRRRSVFCFFPRGSFEIFLDMVKPSNNRQGGAGYIPSRPFGFFSRLTHVCSCSRYRYWRSLNGSGTIKPIFQSEGPLPE